jgi:hypothetical protein
MIANDLAVALDPALMLEAAGLQTDPWQVDFLRSTSARYLLNCSRQAGKSTATAAVAVWEAVYHAPALVLLLSPSLRQSSELFRKVVNFYDAIARPVTIVEESSLRLELANGSRIIALPGTEKTVRGFSGARLIVVDEAARVEDHLYYSIRPMLAVSGGRLVLLSTPFGKRGVFFDAWESGEGFERVKVTGYDVPRIPREFLEEERRAMGDYWFDMEYMGIFRETSEQVFTFEEIEGIADDSIKPLFSQEIFG